MICVTRSPNPKVVGLAHGLQKTLPQHQITYWDSRLPVFKMMTDLNPDVLFFTNDDIPASYMGYLKQSFPDKKFVLLDHKNEDYDVDMKISLVNKQDPFFLQYLADDMMFGEGQPKDYLNCDFFVISNEILAKSQNIINWINALGHKFNIKVFGAPIKSPYFLGSLPSNEIAHCFASSKGIIAFDESWYFNAIHHNIFPLCFHENPDNDDKYIYKDYKSLESMCEKVISGELKVDALAKLADQSKKITYKSFAHRIVKELKI